MFAKWLKSYWAWHVCIPCWCDMIHDVKSNVRNESSPDPCGFYRSLHYIILEYRYRSHFRKVFGCPTCSRHHWHSLSTRNKFWFQLFCRKIINYILLLSDSDLFVDVKIALREYQKPHLSSNAYPDDQWRLRYGLFSTFMLIHVLSNAFYVWICHMYGRDKDYIVGCKVLAQALSSSAVSCQPTGPACSIYIVRHSVMLQ